MAFIEKIKGMAAKFGFTYKGFIVATFAFPPAGAYIAWNWPGKSLIERIFLVLLALTIPAALPILTAAPVYYIYTWITTAYK